MLKLYLDLKKRIRKKLNFVVFRNITLYSVFENSQFMIIVKKSSF
jgi:hypothetical protein